MKIFLKIQSNTVFYMYLLSNNNIFSQKKIVYRSQRSYYNVRIGDLCVAECNTLRHNIVINAKRGCEKKNSPEKKERPRVYNELKVFLSVIINL